MPTSGPLGPNLRELLSQVVQEREQLETELSEISLLLKQTFSEVDKLQPRQADAISRLRQVEANIEAYSGTDIKNAYSNAHESQLRLFVMHSQLENLQAKQRTLQRYQTQLERMGILCTQAADIVEGDPTTTMGKGSLDEHQAVVQVIQAQEAERQHLSRQMHDGPAQSLTNLILQAEIVERTFDADPVRARTELGLLKTAANSTFQRMRDFIFELRPMMLDDLGLIPTLKRFLQTFGTKNHLAISLTSMGDRTLAPHVEVTVFRTVQELVTNAAQHAHPSRVQVTLDLRNDPIQVTVDDDGSGFDVTSVLSSLQELASSGLAKMEQRISMLGGKIQFQSETGRGTKVNVQIPAN